MSSIRKARYDGPSGTGVDLNVELADGQVKPVHIDQGHQLPAEIGGVALASGFVANLLSQGDWSEVKGERPKAGGKKPDDPDAQAPAEPSADPVADTKEN